MTLAANRAKITGASFFQITTGDSFARDAFDFLLVVVDIEKIPVGQHVDDINKKNKAGRAQLPHQPFGNWRLL